MTADQGLLLTLIVIIMGLLLWGRIRYDLVAAGGLLTAVALDLVPEKEAFSGFSNHAVIVVALVLVASRAFENSGALALLARKLTDGQHKTGTHIAMTGGLGAVLSTVINNVAALALLMPLDTQAARRAGRAPGVTLMPLAFATILGGMVTLIGTPPNIIASSIRAERLGMPYQMFDFTPVGLAVAVAGLGFIALVGWRLVPRRADAFSGSAQQFSFMAELRVLDGSPTVGQPFVDLDERAEQADVLLVGLIRKGQHYHALARTMTMEADDLVVVQGSTDGLAEFIKTAGLQEADQQKPGQKGNKETDEAKPANDQEKFHAPEIIECVVRTESRLAGRSIFSFGLRKRFDITVLGISRAGIMWREEVRHRTIEAGDVLLLTGAGTASAATLDLLGLITINRTSVAPFRTRNIVLTVGIFMVAVALASAGLVSFTIAIAGAVAAYALLGFVPAREFYQQIEWPVVVMLACLLPIGAAFDKVGGTALVAGSIVNLTYGYSPVVALVAIMIVTMTLSDVLNNVATMVITGPIAIDMALRLDVNPDTFLMGTAIASSCAFLTPIGHKNNTLIMGPGSYRFADYWRMGLPLEMVVLAVAVPMLLIVWPL